MVGSRDAMIDTTRRLLQRQGMNATGIQEVIDRSGSPRGSVYHHFPGGKTELVAEAIERSGELGAIAISDIVQRAASPASAATRLLADFERTLVESNYSDGCPLATVALEGAADERIADALADAFNRWLSPFEALLVDHGYSRRDARGTAYVVLSIVEGALVLAKAERSPQPLRAARKALRQLLD